MAGYLLDWRHVAAVLIVFPAAGATAMWFLPETPYWLVANDREQQAR